MIEFFKRHLSLKVLVVLVAILLSSFIALGYSIITRQNELLSGMRTEALSKLKETGQDAKTLFGNLADNLDTQLTSMGQATTEGLATVTAQALDTEEKAIGQGMEKLLLSNARAVANVLSKVAEDAIMAKEYGALKDFSQAVAKTEEIVYVFFYDQKDDTLLPGYINIVDDRVLSYLDRAGVADEEDRLLQMKGVVEESKKDGEVMLYEQAVEYYNLPIGKILVCVSRAGVKSEIAAMGGRFADLRNRNEESIKAVIGEQSGMVVSRVKQDLDGVVGENLRAIEETGTILSNSAQQVRYGVTWAVVLVGTVCCAGGIVAVYFMLRFMVIRPIKSVTDGLRDTAEGEGDLTKRLRPVRTDEIGVMARWFDTFVARLNDIIVDIGANAETVTSSAIEVLNASEQLMDESDDLKGRANGVAVASEEMTVSMNSVAAASEQAATNIGFVAQAAAEMRQARD